MKEAIAQLNSPPKSTSREPLRLQRSPLPRMKYAKSPPATTALRSQKAGKSPAKPSVGPAQAAQTQRKTWSKPCVEKDAPRGPTKVEAPAEQPSEQKKGTNSTSGPTDKGNEQNKDNQYILVPLEVQPKDDRNPLSAKEVLRDPVKTYKLELPRPKESNYSSKTQLKSPTRCANTATTSGNVGSLTRAEGDILVRQTSPTNRSRSPPSLGSKIGSGTANLLKDFSKDGSLKNDDNGTNSAGSEQHQAAFSHRVKFLVNAKEESEQR